MAEIEDLDLVISNEQPDLLLNLLSDKAMAQAEYKRRKSEYTSKSVHTADVEQHILDGWEVSRTGKRQCRLKKPKAHHRALEDRAWCFLYRMGYAKIGDKRFKIEFERQNGSKGSKQIDAFAADNETAIVIECKSKEERGKKSLRLDIQETVSLQNYIRKSIFSHFSGVKKPKIIWVYFTSNIIWTDNDIERAKDANIYIITENEIQYFETFLNHLGPAGRHQIIGELLQGQKISNVPIKKVPAIRGTLAGKTFYSFVTTPRDLLRIAFVNHQALNHPDGTPAYQRMISSSRIKQIGSFIKDGGFFPTNILVNFTESPKFELLPKTDNTDVNIKFGQLTLPSKYRSAWIIDGQHRLYGYSGLDDKYLDQSLVVLAFEKLPKVKEADLFITINHKQKSVPPALLVALLADLKMGDADPKTALSALASAVVRTVNADKASPFFQTFRMPDVPPSERQNLTISEVVNGLNRSALLGRVVHKTIGHGPLSGSDDAQTIERARKVLNGYFDAIRSANENRWDAGAKEYIRVNPGIRAHLMLLPEIMSYVSHKKGVDFLTVSDSEVVSNVLEIAQPILSFINTASDDQIKNRFARHFGEGGVKDYLFNLSELIATEIDDFGSEEFKRVLSQRESDSIAEANKDIMAASEIMTDVVIQTLKAVHGTHMLDSGDPAYWELGIPKTQIKERAHNAQQADPLERRKRKEAYLNVLDLKEIIEANCNWSHFQTTFSRAMPGDAKKSSGKYTSWLAKFNDIRKIAAHKNSLRTYTDEDLEFVDWLRADVLPQLKDALNAA
jgi:DNA sulfur modification protein DndB